MASLERRSVDKPPPLQPQVSRRSTKSTTTQSGTGEGGEKRLWDTVKNSVIE